MLIRTIINIFLFWILIFPGHSERSATFRDRRYRQNHNSNFLFHQFDSAGPAGGGTWDSPHQKSCQRAAGGCARVFALHGLVPNSCHCSAQELLGLSLHLELAPWAAFGDVQSWKNISCSWLMSARCRLCSTADMFCVSSLCGCLKSNENISVEGGFDTALFCSDTIQLPLSWEGRAWSRYYLFKVPDSAFSKILQLLQEHKHFLAINEFIALFVILNCHWLFMQCACVPWIHLLRKIKRREISLLW